MRDRRLRREHIRVERIDGVCRVLVGVVGWRDPSTPYVFWKLARELPGDCSKEALDCAVAAVLEDRQYFLVCERCGKRMPRGWMHDEHVCHSCAERLYGIVH